MFDISLTPPGGREGALQSVGRLQEDGGEGDRQVLVQSWLTTLRL